MARPDLSVSRDSGDDYPSYYGRPVIKEPVWRWEIPWYFFTGGLAGAAAKRWSIFKAGFQSARDPEYTLKHQRERLARGPTEGRRTETFGGNGRAT